MKTLALGAAENTGVHLNCHHKSLGVPPILSLVATSKKQSSDFRSEILRLTQQPLQ